MASQSSQPSAQPNPGYIFEELSAYQRSMALKGAIELDLFTIIENGAKTAAEIATKAQADVRGVRILCDFLTVHGHLTKQGREYALTPGSKQFLSKNSRAYMGSMIGFLLLDVHISSFADVAGAVRKGGTVQGEGLMGDDSIWVDFARAMAPMAYMNAEVMAKILHAEAPSRSVLDVAASHGLFGLAVAKLNPEAQVTALDSANVLEVARETAARFGFTARHKLLPGSVFDADLGAGYDLVLVTNFLHAFDKKDNVKVLKRLHAAMAPGGRIAIVEMVPNEDRVSPSMPATFALTMLVNTPGGDAFTFAELKEMLEESGFRDARLEPLNPMPQQLVVARK
jgi:ubiquinone/menaquinone biosynthesis C-methylase UbiE